MSRADLWEPKARIEAEFRRSLLEIAKQIVSCESARRMTQGLSGLRLTICRTPPSLCGYRERLP